MEARAAPSGWYRDPTGRFEYRYFNGVQWTPDVAVNGQRYVDKPMDQVPMNQMTVHPSSPRRPRGMAIASFVTALTAVVVGWVPFIFALAACAAIAAIVFGILALRTARLHDGYGRGFAVTGLVLAPVALAVCVGGFFFTSAVLRELHAFAEPGPHQLFVQQPCTVDGGRATVRGSIRNLDDQTHDYRIVVDFTNPSDGTTSSTVRVKSVRPDATAPWTSSADITGSSVSCKVAEVTGPFPFDLENQS